MTILNAIEQNSEVPRDIGNFFSKIFVIEHYVMKSCERGHRLSLKAKSSYMLNIMVNGDCLSRLMKNEYMERNEYKLCLQCNEYKMHQETSTIFRLPDILGVIVNFPINSFQAGVKILNPLKIPEVFSFDNVDEEEYNYEYNLISVILHHGSTLMSGHYTSICKNIFDASWNHFDDTFVGRDVNLNDYINDKSYSKGQPYVLFYSKMENGNQMIPEKTLGSLINKKTCKFLELIDFFIASQAI